MLFFLDETLSIKKVALVEVRMMNGCMFASSMPGFYLMQLHRMSSHNEDVQRTYTFHRRWNFIEKEETSHL